MKRQLGKERQDQDYEINQINDILRKMTNNQTIKTENNIHKKNDKEEK